MPFLPTKPFNPTTTPVPILGPSSGNPQSLQDPKSVASIGSTIQAMTDQANADQLYDNKEGFITAVPSSHIYLLDIVTASALVTGIVLVACSMR
jgi:hypothetical protein